MGFKKGLGFKVTVRSRVCYLRFTWRVGGLSNWLFLGLISTITPIRVSFRVLISLLTTYLLSPPTLQVARMDGGDSEHSVCA